MGTEIKLLNVGYSDVITIEETRPLELSCSGFQSFIFGYKSIEDVKKHIDEIIENEGKIKFLKEKKESYIVYNEERYHEIHQQLYDYINLKNQQIK